MHEQRPEAVKGLSTRYQKESRPSRDSHSAILALQSAAGNQAVAALLGHAKSLGQTQPPFGSAIGSVEGASPRWPVQRLMVRMPLFFESGLKMAMDSAEVDEMGRELKRGGKEGRGGDKEWGEDWQFQIGEVSYFYGHGNRSLLSGIPPDGFVDEITGARHGMPEDAKMKFVACGGGRSAAGAEAEGSSYGAKVAKLLEARHRDWTGSIKSAEGLVYYTEEGRAVIPKIPDDVQRAKAAMLDAKENSWRESLWKGCADALLPFPTPKRNKELIDFRDAVVTGLLQRKQEFEIDGNAETAQRFDEGASRVAAYELASRQIAAAKSGGSDLLLKKVLRQILNEMFGGLEVLEVAYGIQASTLPAKFHPVGVAANGIVDTIMEEGRRLWETFRAELIRAQNQAEPAAVKPRKELGVKPPGRILPADESARFMRWHAFGPGA